MIGGLDLGSRNVKIILMSGGEIRSSRIEDTSLFYREYGRLVDGQLTVDWPALGLPEVDSLVATGYGRNTLKLAGAVVIPEIKAHALGAVFQTGMEDFTLIDLGGQDSKIIKVERGQAVDFQTNDRCAASTGRYLENMANVLGITLVELGQYAADPVELDATCAIFGETELIGKLVEGHQVANLAAGVNYTIFKRIQPLLRPLLGERIVFTGGVAQSPALQEIIYRETGRDVLVPPYPQLNGAIGCAVFSRK